MMKRLKRWWLRNLWDKLLALDWGLFKGVRSRAKKLPVMLALEPLETRTLPSAQWANSVLGYSSQNSAGNWAASQATGAPNTNFYGHFPTAWAPMAMMGSQEYLTVGFQNNVYATGVTVRETNGNGFITKIDLVDTDNALHTVWTGLDPTAAGAPADFSTSFSVTSYLVKGVKVYVDTNRNPATFEEIDAVQLIDAGAAPAVTGVTPSSGSTAGGTSVVITGTNLTGATQVSFGGTAAASFTVNSATQITATAPAHAAGMVDVIVTTAGGTSAITSADQFTYMVAGPAVTGISPSSGSTAGGTSVVITGTNPIVIGSIVADAGLKGMFCLSRIWKNAPFGLA